MSLLFSGEEDSSDVSVLASFPRVLGLLREGSGEERRGLNDSIAGGRRGRTL